MPRKTTEAAATKPVAKKPATRRTTILLSPADLPKRGTHYDLAIAVAVLAATGVVPGGQPRGTRPAPA